MFNEISLVYYCSLEVSIFPSAFKLYEKKDKNGMTFSMIPNDNFIGVGRGGEDEKVSH